MFVFLSKFLPQLVYPTGLLFILLVLAVFSRRRRLQQALILAALVVLGAGGNRWVAFSLVRSLEVRYPPPLEYSIADAIVVLGGGTEPADAPRPGVEVNGAGDRVIHAARLYRQGMAPLIIASGGCIPWYEGGCSSPAGEIAELLEFMGVPAEDIHIEDESVNTQENADFSRLLLENLQVRRILLVTSAVHMPRSVLLFERQGLEVIPAPADFVISDAEWLAIWQPNLAYQLVNLLPSAGNLSLTTNALKEYIGLLVYSLRGWL